MLPAHLGGDETDRVTLLTTEQLFAYLTGLQAQSATSQEFRGYNVKVRYQADWHHAQAERRLAMSRCPGASSSQTVKMNWYEPWVLERPELTREVIMRRSSRHYPPRKGAVLSGRHGNYEILKQLGSGGRSLAFTANVLHVKKDNAVFRLPSSFRKDAVVIVKVPNLDLSRNPNDIIEFIKSVQTTLLDELVTLSALSDLSCVARILDTGVYPFTLRNGQAVASSFVVEELVTGTPLSGYGPIKTARSWFGIASQLATALREIHRHGTVHRDIWPPNIILRNGKPIFIDFGEAAF